MRGVGSLRAACCLALGLGAAPPAFATVDPFANPPAKPPEAATPAQPARDPPRPDPAQGDRDAEHAPARPAAPAPTTATAPAPQPAPTGVQERRECPLSLDAAPLLREAVSRGIQPRVLPGSACDINPADNEFFGRGGSVDCKLQFANARWLGEGMRFTAITGVGHFEATVSGSGIEVTIPADGGVRFRRVSVQASVKAPAACPAPRPDKVLAD